MKKCYVTNKMKCIYLLPVLCLVAVLQGTLCYLKFENAKADEEDSTENSGGKICEANAANTTEIMASDFPANCGEFTPNNTLNGDPGEVFEYPWMAILVYNGLYAPWCTGTLISKRYILTSAYCIQQYQPIYARLGGQSVNQVPNCNSEDCAPPFRDYEVECATSHQDYRFLVRENDIGLVRTKLEVHFQENIQPICLPLTPELRKMVLPRYIATSWFGLNQVAPVLWKSVVTPGDREKCEEEMASSMKPKSNDSELCIREADYEDPYPCLMEDGGPLGNAVPFNGVRFVQFGVASLPRCNSLPSLYTNVSSYMEWVVANMKP